MNLTFLIVVAAVLGLGSVVSVGLARRQRHTPKAALTELVPLDVEAFRNLTDPAEEDYLRRHLPPAEYRTVRRARLRAMAAYVHLASRNAALLAQIGQAVAMQKDPERARATRRMINDAFLLRRNATVALARIYLALVLPGTGAALPRFQDQYMKVVASAMLFGRLQDPASASRFSLALQ